MVAHYCHRSRPKIVESPESRHDTLGLLAVFVIVDYETGANTVYFSNDHCLEFTTSVVVFLDTRREFFWAIAVVVVHHHTRTQT